MRIYLLVALFGMFLQPSLVIDAVISDHYYAEGLTATEETDLSDAVRGGDTFVVVLADDVADVNGYADRILDELAEGTVLVLTPSEVAAVSDRYDSSTIDTALDVSLSVFDQDIAAGIRAFDDSLAGNRDSSATEPVSSGESSGSGVGFLLFLFLGGGLIGFFVWRSRRSTQSALLEDLEEARDEVRSQVGVVANDILEFSDRVTLAEDEEITLLYAEATATFSGVEEKLASVSSLGEIEQLGHDLDEAKWQLEVVEAKLDGRIPPAKPVDRPARCFFDPTHRAGTEEAEIKTAAGERMVSVCRSCKSQLMRGDKPATRDIAVGGRRIPAPRAPKSYGGQGIDGLDVFSVIVGGANVAFDLRRARQRSRPRSSGIGLPAARSSSSRRSTGSRRSRGSASRSRSRGSSSRRRK